MAKTSVQELIAKSIKDADKSFFNEDYMKQAQSVITGLRKAGFEIVPQQPPSDEFVEFIHKNMPFGRLRPSELVRAMYTLMIQNVGKFGG